MFKKFRIITHNGSFHPDEIFAIATLRIFLKNKFKKSFLKPKIEIIRTRDLSVIQDGDFVIDVGMKYEPENLKFDHHQGGAGQRKNGIIFSSFGLVWNFYGKELCGKAEVFEDLDIRLVQFLDALDNGIDTFDLKNSNIPIYSFYELFEAQNFLSQQEGKDQMKYFLKLLDWAEGILKDEIEYIKILVEQKKELRDILKNNPRKSFVVLEKNYDDMTVQKVLVDYPDILFLIAPDKGNEAWKLKTVRKNSQSFESRKLLPEAWAGKSGGELVGITRVEGAIFCHQGRFIAFAKTKEDVLKMVEIALK
ncbi:MAG: MYG1 family protein [Patescibacteria group bacterium]